MQIYFVENSTSDILRCLSMSFGVNQMSFECQEDYAIDLRGEKDMFRL